MSDFGRPDNRTDQLRIPPNSVEAEQSVLGGLMLAPNAWSRVSDLLTAEDFYRRDHQLIWHAIRHLEDKRVPFDAVTVGEFIEARGMAETVPLGYLIDLARNTPSAANIRAYAEIVADKSRQRRLIEAGTGMVNDGFQPEGRTTDELVADAQAAVTALTNSRGHRLKTTDDGLSEMVEAMERAMNSGDLPGASFGLPDVDEMTGGKRGGDLIIIAGRPSMGKTTFALQGAVASKRPLIFSFETKADRLLARMTSHVGKLPLRWMTQPADAPDFAFDRISDAAAQVRERVSAVIYDGRRLTFDQLRAVALREHAKSPVSEIVIDHLGYMKLAGKGRPDQEMGEVTKGCKDLARELDVPVVLLMQLNRNVEGRPDKRPMLSDLRECGAAEEDADVVLMLYRDGYYNPQSSIREYGELFLRKNRDGDPGEIWTKPCLPEMRFDPAEPQERPGAAIAAVGGNGGIPARGGQGRQPRAMAVAGGDR